ncbi:MAG TPA: response regulator [Candidatus Omnitrophota bacterium]|nr:response regulator [Candidatus Omnitrophota bacterium]HPS21014.1 response regulator [Candidatus Omnitrophota bacterium]
MADPGRKYKIHVIDDEKDLAGAIKDFLESRDFDVDMAHNGRDGLEMIRKDKPDLVILDVMMPLMDGRDVLSALKKDDTTKHIPVIMLTAKDDQFDRDHGLELGAYEYITKPYDSVILLRQVKNILSKASLGGV